MTILKTITTAVVMVGLLSTLSFSNVSKIEHCTVVYRAEQIGDVRYSTECINEIKRLYSIGKITLNVRDEYINVVLRDLGKIVKINN